jgi:hypothetical protein
MRFERIDLGQLSVSEIRKYNYNKVTAALADYGFATELAPEGQVLWDFVATQLSSGKQIKVLIRPQMTLEKKFLGKDIYICFLEGSNWYIYPHDQHYEHVRITSNLMDTTSWKKEGTFTVSKLSAQNKLAIARFKIAA